MKKLNVKWKILIIALLILPCVVFFAGCGEDDTGSGGTNSNVTYTVIFYTASGDEFNYASKEVKSGKLVTRPSDPQKQGYVFIGWYKDIELTQVWKFESDVVMQDMVLFAKWEIRNLEDIGDVYTVKFVSNSEEEYVYQIQEVKEGNLISRPSVPSKNGYVFIGWYKDPECTEIWNFENDIATSSITLYAKWEKR